MSWENHGEWHLDHIKPLSSFDPQDPEQVMASSHYTNFQPLWAEDNLKKADKYLSTSYTHGIPRDAFPRAGQVQRP